MRITEVLTESSKICPQCGMKGCTCKPGTCKCKPKPGYPKNIDEAANPAQQAAIAISMKKAGKKPKSVDEADMNRRGFLKGLGAAAVAGAAGGAGYMNRGLKDLDKDGEEYVYNLLLLYNVSRALTKPGYHTVSVKEAQQVFEQVKSIIQQFIKDNPSLKEKINQIHKTVRPGEEWIGVGVPVPYGNKNVIISDFTNWYKNKTNPPKPEFESVEQGVAEGENWSKHNNPRAGGMSKKSVKSYRRSHPGSKIQTAVTTKPSKIKKGSKDAKRRKSFCARMRGMKKHNTSAKTKNDPNSNINKSLRRWHCESIEQMQELVILAEQFLRKAKL
jgi:hypothetical protein